MKRIAAVLGLVLLLDPPMRLSAQSVDRTRPPAMRPAPALAVPPMQSATLSNGLQLYVVEMHEVPVVDIQLFVDAGALRDPADLPGLATFTANMLDEGAGQRSALDIAEEAGYLGARLFTFANFDMAGVSLHVPKRRLEAALDLFADVVLRPTFPDSEVVRQRDLRKAQLLQLRDQPVQMANVAYPAILFGDQHPYGRPLAGTDSSVLKLDRERVRQFHESLYRPNNARIMVVGDVTVAEARRLIEARLGRWARASVPALRPSTTPAPARRTIFLVDKPGAAQSVFRIGHEGVARSTPDYFAGMVMNTILGGSFTSRLNQNLRETHGYTYGAGSAFSLRRLPGPFTASASVVTAKTDSALIQFMYELRRIRDSVVPAEELEKAKSYIMLGLPRDFETTSGAAGQYSDIVLYDLPRDYYRSYIDRVRAVTAADVQRVARQYIDPDHFAIVIVGDRAQIEAGLRALNEGTVVYRDLWGKEPR
jgi:zinc protease